MDRSVLTRKSVAELRDIASALQMSGYNKLRKAELIDAIIASGDEGSGSDADDSDGDDSVIGDADAGTESRDGQTDDDDASDGAGHGARGSVTRTRTSSRRGSGGDTKEDDDTAQADAESKGDHEQANRSRKNRRNRNRNRGREDSDNAADAAPSAEADRSGQGGNGQGGNGRDTSSGSSSSGDSRSSKGQDNTGGGKDAADAADAGEVRAGVLDILPEGYGFLRTTGYLPGDRDVYVSQGQVRKQRLRRGDVVQGPIRQQRSNEKVPALHNVQAVNGEALVGGQVADRAEFAALEQAFEPTRIDLGESSSTAARAIDVMAPLSDGQRALVMVPPAADGTSFMIELACALGQARPDSHLMLVMVDQAPEVVLAARDQVDGELIVSTFDQPAEDHTQIAELAINRARRMVELGHDVIIVLDSLTRLARAYGITTGSSGRSIAPDLEAASLYPPKQFMAAARSTEDAGSLTIIASVLTDTGSAHDEVIRREFERVANCRVVLDQALALEGIWPPLSVTESRTRALNAQNPQDSAVVDTIRRALAAHSSDAASMVFMDKLTQTPDNAAFLAQIDAADLAAAH